jgi:hypothetical protein
MAELWHAHRGRVSSQVLCHLASLLADPAATRGPDTAMPDLDLTGSEIAALTAFINRERPVLGSPKF